MKHELQTDGKLTVSLQWKEWVAVVAALVAVITFVLRSEDSRKRSEDHIRQSHTEDSVLVSLVNRHEWRLRRVEKKVGIKRESNGR